MAHLAPTLKVGHWATLGQGIREIMRKRHQRTQLTAVELARLAALADAADQRVGRLFDAALKADQSAMADNALRASRWLLRIMARLGVAPWQGGDAWLRFLARLERKTTGPASVLNHAVYPESDAGAAGETFRPSTRVGDGAGDR